MTAAETTMRSIIFSDPMVRAILGGRKTQTRRVMPLNATGEGSPRLRIHNGIVQQFVSAESATRIFRKPHDGGWITCVVGSGNRGAGNPLTCKYGVPGDRLWVREALEANADDIWYRADDSEVDVLNAPKRPRVIEYREGIISPIHMPQWASRITLEIMDVRVQQVQAISEVDAWAEGVSGEREFSSCVGGLDIRGPVDVRKQYRELWDRINGKKHPWSSNPWVWAITFKRVEAIA